MKKWMILILMVILSPNVLAIANYGVWQYGQGHYGTNTPPNVTIFIPSSLAPTIDPNTNQDFNVTFTDFDNDTVTLSWYIDTVPNATNQNITLNFSAGTYTVVANLTDPWNDSSKVIWSFTITLVGTGFNLSDVIIAPKITNRGNLIIVKVNITALNNNLTNIDAFLNVGKDYTFLIETPQNKSISNIWTTNVTQINWIISTPSYSVRDGLNISYTNSSASIQGQNKNISVEQEGDSLLAMSILLIFVISSYVFIILKLTGETFKDHGLIKVSIFTAAVWFLLIPMNASIKINELDGVSQLTSSLNTFFYIMIYLNVAITLYMIVFLIVGFVRSVNPGDAK